jgi:hypothetical protein
MPENARNAGATEPERDDVTSRHCRFLIFLISHFCKVQPHLADVTSVSL